MTSSSAEQQAKHLCLPENDARAVAEWARGAGLPDLPDDTPALYASLGMIAADVFKGQKTSARRALDALESGGAISRVKQGRKGAASVYVLTPVLITETPAQAGAFHARHYQNLISKPIDISPWTLYNTKLNLKSIFKMRDHP